MQRAGESDSGRPRPRPVRDRTARAALLVAQLLPARTGRRSRPSPTRRTLMSSSAGGSSSTGTPRSAASCSASDVRRAMSGSVIGTTLREVMAQELRNRPCGGRYGDIVQAIGNTPLVELKRLSPKPGVRAVGEDGVAQPDGLGQGPRRARADRGRRGEGRDPPGPDDPRADLRQHRHLAGDDLLAQGLQAQGRHARQRDARAHAAAEDVRRRDRLLAGQPGLQRRGRAGAEDGVRGLLVLHALPVRQRGEPGRALQRHGAGDPRGARRGRRVRRRPRHGRDADGRRPAAARGARATR